MNNLNSLFDKTFLFRKCLLNLVLKNGLISRTAIGNITGIRPSTISDLSRELIAEGILKEAGDAADVSQGSAAKRDLMLNPDFCRLIGIDVQVHQVVSILTDFCGNILNSFSSPIRPEFRQTDICRLIYDCLDRQMEAASGFKILGIGLSTIGILDRRGDTIRMTFARSNWSHVKLKEMISSRYPDIPVFIEDEVVCKLYAEKWLAKNRDNSNAIFIDSGDIVSCSMYYDGKILRNTQGISGEIGHFFIEDNDDICSCGNVGCLFLSSSSNMLVRKVKKILEGGTISVLNDMTGYDLSQLTISMILEASALGDRVANNILTTAALHMGQAISYVVNLLGPSQVILGGNLATDSDFFAGALIEEAKKRSLCFIADYMSFQKASFPVFGGALGSICMVLEDYFSFPSFSF
ncbi:MAG: ROK family protein [Lachnospiraceae bacterium]|nr:ROK family protein [Lachnospiraceae bacterium]